MRLCLSMPASLAGNYRTRHCSSSAIVCCWGKNHFSKKSGWRRCRALASKLFFLIKNVWWKISIKIQQVAQWLLLYWHLFEPTWKINSGGADVILLWVFNRCVHVIDERTFKSTQYLTFSIKIFSFKSRIRWSRAFQKVINFQ